MNHVATVYNSAAHRMECELCTEQFDLQARRPKVTPCGHTACMACLSHLQEKRCPSCRKALTKSAAQLPDNFKLLDLMREEHDWNSSRRCFWCLACKEVAKEGCMDDHPVRRIKAAVRQRMKQLRDLLPQLTKDTQDMLEALANDEREGEILAAMKLLDGPDTFCSLVLHSKGDSKSLAANWELAEGPPTLKDPQRDKLLRMLVLLLVKTGELKEEGKPLVVMDPSHIPEVNATVGEGEQVPEVGVYHPSLFHSGTTDQKTSQSTDCESGLPVHKSALESQTASDQKTVRVHPSVQHHQNEVTVQKPASDSKTVVIHPNPNEKITDQSSGFKSQIEQGSAKDGKIVTQKPATGETILSVVQQLNPDHKFSMIFRSGKLQILRHPIQESEKITAQQPASNSILLPFSSENQNAAAQQPPSTVAVQQGGLPSPILALPRSFVESLRQRMAKSSSMSIQPVNASVEVLKAPNAVPPDNTVQDRQVVRAPAADPIPYLDVYYLSKANSFQRDKAAKPRAELLEKIGKSGVLQLGYVECCDPAWTLKLLQTAAPHLRKIQLKDAGSEHLAVVHAMPRLQRLHVIGCSDLNLDPPVLPPLHTATLTWLRVKALPRETVLSILKAHAATLRGVVMEVGVTGPKWWPENCNDLHVALSACGLRALQILVLDRPSGCYTDREAKLCEAQLKAVGSVLRGVEVVCLGCSDVDQVHLEV